MLTWNICNVNWTSADTSRGRMKARIIMNGLKHVPVWDEIEVLCKQCIVGIYEDMPRMTARDFGEEVIRISDKDRRFVLRHLRVEEDLRSLGHAGNSFYAEMTQC